MPEQKSTTQKGREGEDSAADFLIKKGYEIIKRNFHFGRSGEMDIIAKDGNFLVFVEVKARQYKSYGSPLEAITYSKTKALRRVAEGWLYVNKIVDQECRFDVIAVDMSKAPFEIEHIENAF